MKKYFFVKKNLVWRGVKFTYCLFDSDRVPILLTNEAHEAWLVISVLRDKLGYVVKELDCTDV